MKYDFTTLVDRKNTGSAKWEQMADWNSKVAPDTVPLSIADMELKNPPEIIEGLKEYLDETILGYTLPYPSFYKAVVNWQKKRHNWTIEPEWIINTQGVVAAFYAAIRAFSNKGDGIIVFRPVYYPFLQAIEDNERTEVNVPLIETDGHYTIDFDAFEEVAAKAENKILIFCSPHNPVGRVWTKEELQKLAEIIIQHDLLLISDEIWYDFIMPGHTHTVTTTAHPQLKKQTITCTAPSKSFNLAGLGLSNIIIEDPKIRERFRSEIEKVRGDMINIFGFKACEIAYTKSEAWLDELLTLIKNNHQVVHDFFQEKFPKIKAPFPEGTYLQWLDFRALALSDEELEQFLHQEAEFFTDEGYIFGEEGSGFERINVALPTDVLKTQLYKLEAALKQRGY
ncbi:MalY/PatB family protein [Jeotgalibaca ciconiae]|uniref:cysteine-S-conjugate beta-lyase n=1 Tax=Jeotgalibaca ciconiae TaxID=2496265 RepID=A0A3Q9BLV8_9LACT|nr:MalY/PatB family protein [Jeotgalibaca ciconiae]AZP03972.1 pyridoxal phosphate-dependent aminotransferase [Jeotgalibaca ciconiae]HJB23292.1 pyridoxal phosphate-dependent aminotransferase [Candidatus Jeotgalibaca pullicola]